MKLYVTDDAFRTLSGNLTSGDAETNKVSLLALAKCISDSLDLNKEISFGKDHSVKVMKLIYDINDSIVVPIQELNLMVRNFFSIRTANAYPKSYISQSYEVGTLKDVFNISTYLSKKECDVIDKEYKVFVKGMYYSSMLLDELSGDNSPEPSLVN